MSEIVMSDTEVKVIIVYAAGFLVTPFVSSLVDGWPLVKPRGEGVDSFIAFLMSLFWPVVAVVWLVATWWCASSWLGMWLRKAVAGLFRRRRAK